MDRRIRIKHEIAQRALDSAIADLRALSGEIVGPSGADWHDIAGTCAVNLSCVLRYVKQCRRGESPFPVFPEVRIGES